MGEGLRRSQSKFIHCATSLEIQNWNAQVTDVLLILSRRDMGRGFVRYMGTGYINPKVSSNLLLDTLKDWRTWITRGDPSWYSRGLAEYS